MTVSPKNQPLLRLWLTVFSEERSTKIAKNFLDENARGREVNSVLNEEQTNHCKKHHLTW